MFSADLRVMVKKELLWKQQKIMTSRHSGGAFPLELNYQNFFDDSRCIGRAHDMGIVNSRCPNFPVVIHIKQSFNQHPAGLVARKLPIQA